MLEKNNQNTEELNKNSLTKWRLWVSYDGTFYCGWQKQRKQKTIEGEIRKAIKAISKQSVSIVCAGRTDTGVHARSQAVSFFLKSNFTSKTLVLALNQNLPSDISAWRADKMPNFFNARIDCIGKHYVYYINQGLGISPFSLRYSWQIKKNLNINKINEAERHLIGEHNYESFRSSRCTAAHAKRYLWEIKTERIGNLVAIGIKGNAFCHNMVRIIVGSLVEVGVGKIEPIKIREILISENRNKAGATAPPKGLNLTRVFYPDNLVDAKIPKKSKFPRYPAAKKAWSCRLENIRIGCVF